jgi:hypothetical protein
MKGIQNNTSESIYYTHLWFTPLQRDTINVFFSGYTTFSIDFNVDSIGGTTNIQTIFGLVPRCLKHFWCYRSHSVPYAGIQVLKVVELNLVLHITPQEKIQ